MLTSTTIVLKSLIIVLTRIKNRLIEYNNRDNEYNNRAKLTVSCVIHRSKNKIYDFSHW